MQRGGRVSDLVGMLRPGSRPLEGKCFYLDEVKSRPSSVLTDVIGRLGGKVESFLHKDVSVVITGNREALSDASSDLSPTASAKKVKGEAVSSPHSQKEKANNAAQRPGTPRPQVCGSRGKALLEKAIRNNKSHGSVLANARSWGVKIVNVDEFLKFVDRLTIEISNQKRRRSEKKTSTSSGARVVKAAVLKEGYMKIEDCSRKYRPLYVQSLSFPVLSYTGKNSPFETPTPKKRKEEEPSKDQLRNNQEPISSHDKPSAPHRQTPSPRRPRKKGSGYCECCQACYSDRDKHLESDLHSRFVQDVTNYTVLDKLIDGMDWVFSSQDPVQMRLSGDSPDPKSTSEEVGRHYKSKVERASPSVLFTHPDPPPADLGTNTVDASIDLEPVSHALPHLQKPVGEAPPQTTSKTKCLDAKVNIHPESETQAPSRRSEGISTAVHERHRVSSPVPHVLSVDFDGTVESSAKELAEVDICRKSTPSPVPQKEPTVDTDKGSSACFKSPRQQLVACQGGESEDVEQGGCLITVKRRNYMESPSLLKLSKRKHRSERTSFMPLCPPLSPLWSMNLLVEVNRQKRCRSFTLSPFKPSKKRRTGQWSGLEPDLLNASAAVGDSGPQAVADTSRNESNTSPEASDFVGHKFETLDCGLLQDILAEQTSTVSSVAGAMDRLSFQHDQQTDCGARNKNIPKLVPSGDPKLESSIIADNRTGLQSEPGPPELHPFYYDDNVHRPHSSFTDPPILIPAVPLLSPSKKAAQRALSQASSASLLSHSISSVCIESALIPDCNLSPTSSESDWDSGLLSRLAPAGQLQPKSGPCEVDLGILLQRSCTGLQDGTYASQLCSVLQPTVPSPSDFEDTNPNPLYRPIEAMDRWIIQSLGV